MILPRHEGRDRQALEGKLVEAFAAPSFDRALQLGTGDALASPLLPGFALALNELFGE